MYTVDPQTIVSTTYHGFPRRGPTLIRTLGALTVLVDLLLIGCVSIPDYVLVQDQQRQQLLRQCGTELDTAHSEPNPSRVSLAACEQHQILAVSMVDDILSRSRDGLVSREEWVLAENIINLAEVVHIETCYAQVKQGGQVRDAQGRSGIAVCDRLEEERRHRALLKVLRRLWHEATRPRMCYTANGVGACI